MAMEFYDSVSGKSYALPNEWKREGPDLIAPQGAYRFGISSKTGRWFVSSKNGYAYRGRFSSLYNACFKYLIPEYRPILLTPAKPADRK